MNCCGEGNMHDHGSTDNDKCAKTNSSAKINWKPILVALVLAIVMAGILLTYLK